MSVPGPYERLTDSLTEVWRAVDRISVSLLRIAIGTVFVWFGALELTGDTPVARLVADTLPFLPKGFIVPALGIFEVLLGVALLIGRRLDLVVIPLVLHLTGTFLVLVVTPQTAFANHNPLMLTMVGEFVVKNVVLIAAALVVATKCAQRIEMANRDSFQPAQQIGTIIEGSPLS
jgi:putative oxidoreductase